MSVLADRFRAAVLGLAVGDALGFPLHGVPPKSLLRLPELGGDLSPRPRGRFARGQFSDDTQLALATAESVIREGRVDGRSLGAHYAWMWQEGVVLHPPRPLAEALRRLSEGMPWMAAGEPLGAHDPSCLSRALIIGLWDLARPPGALERDAAVAAVVTHRDPLCAAAAAAYARVVLVLTRGEPWTARALLDAAAQSASAHSPALADELSHLDRLLLQSPARALPKLRRVGVPARDLPDEGLPAHVTPILLTVLFLLLRLGDDFRTAMREVLVQGGESDVAAALLGGLLGARLGTAGIPARLRSKVLYADHLVDVADRLYRAAVRNELVVEAAPKDRAQRK